VPIRQSRKLLIDLGQFFEILEYSSSSEVIGSTQKLFGPSLQLSLGASRTEMAQTSMLPEPTRVERQEFGNTTPTTVRTKNNISQSQFQPHLSAAVDSLIYSEDELAVLAESFFHQRPELDGQANWWNVDSI
jgi:hypothetical protein